MQTLPTRFETVLRAAREFGPLILKVDEDLSKFRKLARFCEAQDAGALCVLSGGSGKGKTTAVYASSVLLREVFNPVLSVPTLMSLALREIPKWLAENLPPVKQDRVTPVLIDGRESTDDEQGLRDVMGALNNLVRGRPDLIFVWPTTDQEWQNRLVQTARRFGSASFCPERGVFQISGPAKSQWVDAAGLVLDQLGASWDEFGINQSSAEQLTNDWDTLGDFLNAVNQVRVDQEDFSENVTGLPEVIFVVSSHSQVTGDVARLRNPSTYKLRTDELIGSARRQEVGKFWRERGAAQKSNLAWVSSLLQAKLVSLTPSTVAHACGVHASEGSGLRAALSGIEFRGKRSNGVTAFNTTDLARFLDGKPVPEVLNRNKGRTSQATLEAYDAIQAISAKKHKEINKAILTLAGQDAGRFDPEGVRYEVSLGGDAIADAVVPAAEREFHFEFHHISGEACSPNKIATYIMKKLRVYATQYNLIER